MRARFVSCFIVEKLRMFKILCGKVTLKLLFLLATDFLTIFAADKNISNGNERTSGSVS